MFDETILLSFRDELRREKTAGFGDVVARQAGLLKNIGSGAGVGMTAGGLAGALGGGVSRYREARRSGEDVGNSVVGGLSGAVSGGLHGAALGGAAGALGGGAATAMGKDLSMLGQRGGMIGAGSRFGQRQVHSVTGMLSPQELRDIRGGSFDAHAARARAVGKYVASPSPGALKDVERAAKATQASDAVTGMQDPTMNLTSIPGYLRAAQEHGAKQVLKAGLKEQMRNTHPAMAAMMIGAPALSAVGTLASKKETDDQGRGRFERLGKEVGNVAGGVAGGVMPVVGQSIVGGTLGRAGQLAGRGIDKLRGKPGAPGMSASTSLEPQSDGQNIPSERITSPAAAGRSPDIGM